MALCKAVHEVSSKIRVCWNKQPSLTQYLAHSFDSINNTSFGAVKPAHAGHVCPGKQSPVIVLISSYRIGCDLRSCSEVLINIHISELFSP